MDYPLFKNYFLHHGRQEREPWVLKPFYNQICDALTMAVSVWSYKGGGYDVKAG
ncbi:MAG: hypothetical protein ABR913_07140 [Sedimentisphaerales bacterium]